MVVHANFHLEFFPGEFDQGRGVAHRTGFVGGVQRSFLGKRKSSFTIWIVGAPEEAFARGQSFAHDQISLVIGARAQGILVK